MYRFFIVCFFIFIANPFIECKQKIHIASYNGFLVPGEQTYLNFERICQEYDVEFFVDLYKYADNFVDSDDLYKIIFLDYCSSKRVTKIPKHKLICCKWEAAKTRLQSYDPYCRVYTFDDDMIDNVKFFKFCYPVLQPMIEEIPSFKDRKLCTMMAGNWTPQERRTILDFFANKPVGSFEFYGNPPEAYKNHPMAKGIIQGFSSSQQKLHTLKNYRFCICFENTHTTMGYITEKIFDVFAAGCIPIYWGPKNITDFVPLDCFIDYRMFQDNEELYEYLLNFTEEQFEQYLANIKAYLQSEKAFLFSAEAFENLLLQALKAPPLLEEIDCSQGKSSSQKKRQRHKKNSKRRRSKKQNILIL